MASSEFDWEDIVEAINREECTPIISNQVINNLLFKHSIKYNQVVQRWAKKYDYPLADGENLTRVAQFVSVMKNNKPSTAKSHYIRFLTQSLLDIACEEEAYRESIAIQGFLDEIKMELRGDLTFSKLATDRLHMPRFNSLQEEPDNPLSMLARLKIPIYLTTSHHCFIEAALQAIGKEPHAEVYCWHDDLEGKIPAECKSNPDFKPTVQTPLIYHLHGIDSYRDSLVLTEDDHLEFLVNVTQDIKDKKGIPNTVRKALSDSSLLLVGYELHAWDLRVLLYGLIKQVARHPRSFAIQITPGENQGIIKPRQFQRYLEELFKFVEFNVYWGDPEVFMQTLWERSK